MLMQTRNPYIPNLDFLVKPMNISVRAKVEKVIFNDPATIVIWSDGTKTVVKCQSGDTYDEEKGLLMCICKKYFGNTGNFNEVLKKWVPEKRVGNSGRGNETKIKKFL